MTYDAALTAARAEIEHLGPLHALNHPAEQERLLRPRVEELLEQARVGESRARTQREFAARQWWIASHSREFHAHQEAVRRMGYNARCEPGCMCEEEPW